MKQLVYLAVVETFGDDPFLFVQQVEHGRLIDIIQLSEGRTAGFHIRILHGIGLIDVQPSFQVFIPDEILPLINAAICHHPDHGDALLLPFLLKECVQFRYFFLAVSAGGIPETKHGEGGILGVEIAFSAQ